MPFLILFFLVVTALPLPWPEPYFGWQLRGSLLAIAGLSGLSALAAAGIARRTRRRLLRDPGDREAILRAYSRGRLLHLFGLMAAHGLMLWLLGWGWDVRVLCGAATPDDLPFGAELLMMAPFVVGLLLSWACFYSAERAASGASLASRDRPFGGRWGYVSFLARQHLAIMGVPLVLFVIQQGLLRAFPEWFASGWAHAAMFGMVVVAIVLSPWALRLVLGARSLPGGPLRERLEAAARRLRFRYSNILLWDTHRGVVNAMVAGPLPWVRYVFLSDRLLDELTPDEVEAVFGHEVGHIRHGHLPYYMAFLILSMTLLVVLWVMGMTWLFGSPTAETALAGESMTSGMAEVLGYAPPAFLVGAYVFVVFGFLSRRCERQADIYGCRAVSCPSAACDGHLPGVELAPAGRSLCPTGIRIFISALNKVADLNGISRRKPGWLQSWMHASIARRVEFLERVTIDRAVEARFQRRLGLLKWGLLLGLVAALAALSLCGHGDAVWAVL